MCAWALNGWTPMYPMRRCGSGACAQAIKGWQEAGWAVRPQIVSGPSFWSTSEIELAPALIARTLEALS